MKNASQFASGTRESEMASLHSVFRSPRSLSPSPSRTPGFFAGGKEGARLIINYLPALPRKAIAITSRSRGQGDQSAPFSTSLAHSRPPPPPRTKIYFVRARGRRTMRELGKCVTRLPTLFIFARRNTPGRHAARNIPERSGLVGRSVGPRDEVWLILYARAHHWPAKPYVDCEEMKRAKMTTKRNEMSERGRKRKRREREERERGGGGKN